MLPVAGRQLSTDMLMTSASLRSAMPRMISASVFRVPAVPAFSSWRPPLDCPGDVWSPSPLPPPPPLDGGREDPAGGLVLGDGVPPVLLGGGAGGWVSGSSVSVSRAHE